MSKWTLCLFMTILLTVFSAFPVFAEEETEDLQLNTPEESEEASEEAVMASVPSIEPTTDEIIPADYPALTINAISNFFPSATAEYCASKKQVEVTYSLRCSKNMMSVQWFLYYDPDVLTLSKEINTPAAICPTIGGKASVTYGDGVVFYSSSNVKLYDFSTVEKPFVTLFFDVNELDPEEANITKVDLTVDMLCASELDPKTRKSDPDHELILVSNTEVYERSVNSVRISRNTRLSPSNFVQATTAVVTTAPPPTDENGDTIPVTPDEPEESSPAETVDATASTDATSHSGAQATTVPLTAPSDPPQPTEAPPEDTGPVGTGRAGYAFICLGALIVVTSALFIMRKKEILYN